MQPGKSGQKKADELFGKELEVRVFMSLITFIFVGSWNNIVLGSAGTGTETRTGGLMGNLSPGGIRYRRKFGGLDKRVVVLVDPGRWRIYRPTGGIQRSVGGKDR